MNWKYILAGLFALLYIAYLILQRQQGTSPEGMANLSYDICLNDSAYQVLEVDTAVRRRYIRYFWVDSTSQYFSKTLVSPSLDTLFVSNFNKVTFESVNKAMKSAGFETMARQMELGDTFRYQFLFSRKGPDAFFNRLLLIDPRFESLTLIDQMGRDSSAIRREYEAQTITKYLQKCL